MAELRLVGVSEDGEHLVLIDDSGVQHTIVIDERLRAGVHGHLSRLGQLTMALESRISPREIQNRVRSGESADHVAQTAGVPVERVLRFVGPVLREREHVADQARRARLAGTNGPSPLLGDLVTAAAGRRGVDADEVAWDSARREDHTWVVSTAWPDGSAAIWGLDLLRHQATPLDAAARKISGVDDAGSDAVSSAPARGFPDFADSPEFARFDASEDDESGAAPASRGRTSTTGRKSSRSDANVHRLVPRTVPMPVDEPVDDETLDDETLDDESPTADIAGDDDAEVAAHGGEAEIADGESSGDAPAGPTSASRPRSPSGRGARRAAVPTWDDIMFGMKPKDGS